MTERTERSGLLASVAGYTSANALRLAIAGIVGIIVARYLGPAQLGLLGFATSVYTLAVPIGLLGMRQVLVRDFSTHEDWRPTLASALARQLPVSILAAVVSFLIVAASRDFASDAMLIALALLPYPVLATRDTLEALHEAVGNVKLIATITIGAVVISSSVRVLGVILDAPLWFFAAATTIEALVVLVGFALGSRELRISRSLGSSYERDRARRLIRESVPLLIGGIAVVLYMRLDVAMLGLMAGDEETGLYVAASRISEIWYFLPVAAAAAVRPRLARLYSNGEMGRYDVETQQFLSLSWAVSLVAVVLTLVLGGVAIELLYGSAFSEASPILQIHILAAPFVFLGVAASEWFIDRSLTKTVMYRSVIGALINIVLNLALIPSLGATGAAIATLAAYGWGVFGNAFFPAARPVLVMQLRAFIFARR